MRKNFYKGTGVKPYRPISNFAKFKPLISETLTHTYEFMVEPDSRITINQRNIYELFIENEGKQLIYEKNLLNLLEEYNWLVDKHQVGSW